MDILPNGENASRKNIALYISELGEKYYYINNDGDPLPYNLNGILKITQNTAEGRKMKDINTFIVKPKVNSDEKEDELHTKIKSHLFNRREVCSVIELSDVFDCGVSKVRDAISKLHESGHTIRIQDDTVIFDSCIPKAKETVLSVKKMTTGLYKFGVTGDNHLCSRYERMDVLNALYDLYEQEGIKIVYNTGNWIDGEARFNKHDLHTHGLDNQINYFLKNYPQRKGITTRLITGDDHEGWYSQREGVDVGRYMQMKAIEQGRSDLIHIGHMEHDEVIEAKNGKTTIRVLHPGGGSSYATSYSVQKIVESYTGGDKPDILFVGHYHKADYVFCRGVHCVQTGCTMDQSPFMRKKKLAAHLGGWIIEIGTDENGAVTRFKQEFIPFYDKGYYDGWKYKW